MKLRNSLKIIQIRWKINSTKQSKDYIILFLIRSSIEESTNEEVKKLCNEIEKFKKN